MLISAEILNRYRAAAYGVVYAGSTMASFVFPNLLLALNSYYPFRGVLLLFGKPTMYYSGSMIGLEESIIIRAYVVHFRATYSDQHLGFRR